MLTRLLRGVDPLSPDDIAEVVVFAVGRKDNVVIADTLIFPSHQVCVHPTCMKLKLIYSRHHPKLHLKGHDVFLHRKGDYIHRCEFLVHPSSRSTAA